MVGKRLGHYDILAPLGTGGMGEVYRARDTTLKRDVAVKVLSAEFVDDPNRLARLEREAHLLASLNHPNIATIHSLEQEGDARFLVLELVKGQSLEQQLTAGPLTVEKAVDFGKQIAEALEAAHGEGIIHRDLKPANVMITPDGRAKVLDFGIAKSVAAGATNVGTQATNLTVAGTLVGTVPYMSPEQIRGETVDKRVDVWAFGCVLFEMLTGGNPFGRETVADTLAAIIEQEPDWGRLPAPTPDSVRSLLQRCLQKDRKLRLRDLGDAWVEMNALTTDSSGVLTGSISIPGTVPAGAPIVEKRSAIPWLVAALIVGVAAGVLGMWFSTAAPSPAPMIRAELVVPETERISGDIALSPDGRDLVYVANPAEAGDRLYHLPLGAVAATEIEGTDGAAQPFFSPDGESVGFFAGTALNKVSLTNGRVFTVCADCEGTSGTWLADDTIVFARARALYQVPADGGGAEELLAQPGTDDAAAYQWPSALPGAQGVLVQVNQDGRFDVGILLAGSDQVRILVENDSRPKYSVTGHIMFSRQGTLFALPIDPQSWQATGLPEPVVEGVPTNFEMSNEGTIVHRRKSVLSNDVFLVDFEGNPTRLTTDTKRYWDVRLAPDQRRVAFAADEASGGPQRIWVWDLSRPDFEPQPIHFDGVGRYPAWYFDGTRVAFSQDAPDVDNTIQWVAPNDPNQVVEPLTTIQGRPDSFSPDGTVLAFWHGSVRTGGDTDRDIMLLPMQGDRTPIRYIATPAREGAARFSPDGRWLTYTSNITGQFEVYVTPYRGLSVPPEKFQVSQGGGENAVWAHDGKTIYYRHGDKMMEVAFDDEPEMRIGDPELLFEGEYRGGETRQMYDIGPEGEGFLMLTVPQEPWPNSINVILNWFEELKQRVPTGR